MFQVDHRTGRDTEPFVYYEGAQGETIALGQALTLSAGKLTKCASTAKPMFICMGMQNPRGEYPVIRVLPTTVFQVPASASQSALVPGSTVTLASDGLQVTAATSGGVFTLEIVAPKAGGCCTGYFA